MNGYHFAAPTQQSWPQTLRGFWRASYSVFYVRGPLHRRVADSLRSHAQPLQPNLADELAAITAILKEAAGKTPPVRLKQKELLGLMGVLMQFTAVLPQLRPYCITPYSHIEKLYEEITEKGREQPLDFAAQLRIALRQTKGDLVEALWRLFITSRQYARWYDNDAIRGLPPLSDSQAIAAMAQWSRSVKATKAHGQYPDQDTAGDTYYCWTHALAKVCYNSLAARRTPLVRAEALALHHGTRLNHRLAHKLKPQGVPSDHTVAAAYGNAIGERCVAYLGRR